MEPRTKISIIVPAAAIFSVIGGAAGIPGIGGDDDQGETAITGTALEQASRAALKHVGEGRVTATEDEDEESQYEVEVTLNNGSQVDVQLDRDFQVVDSEADDNDAGGADEPDNEPDDADEPGEVDDLLGD